MLQRPRKARCNNSSSDAHENAASYIVIVALEWVVGLLIDTWADTLFRMLCDLLRECSALVLQVSLSAGELLLRMGSSDSGVITNVVRIPLTHSSLQPSRRSKFHKFFCIPVASISPHLQSSGAKQVGSHAQSAKLTFFEKTIEYTLPYLVCQQDDLLEKYASVLADLGQQRKGVHRGRADGGATVVEESIPSQDSTSANSVTKDVRTLIQTHLQFIIPRILMLRDNEKRLVAIKFMLTRLSRKKPVFDEIINKSFLKVLKHLCWLVAENDDTSMSNPSGDALGALSPRIHCHSKTLPKWCSEDAKVMKKQRFLSN